MMNTQTQHPGGAPALEFDLFGEAPAQPPDAVTGRAVLNEDKVPPGAVAKGCCLVAFTAYQGWNFNCQGDGYLTIYRCGRAEQAERRYRVDARLAAKLREIGNATAMLDAERTRRVLMLFDPRLVEGH